MTATAARSSPRTSSSSDRQGGAQASPEPFQGDEAAAQVPRDDLQLHRDGFGKASVSQFGCGDDHNAVASETFNLCIEAMANQIGEGIETFAAHAMIRTS